MRMMMKPNNTRTRNRQGSRGVALITALLLLSLFTVMTLAMVIATSSDLLIDGYYRNLRGSFYAADSGLNAARQLMINQLANDVTANYVQSATTPPIAVGEESVVMSALSNSSTGFGGTQSTLSSSGPQASSWPGSFTISYNAACANTGPTTTIPNCPTYMKPWNAAECAPNYVLVTPNSPPNPTTYPPPTCANPGDPTQYTVNSYSYSYPYKITAVGNSIANQQNTIEETGNMIATVSITNSFQQSFAAYGTFFNSYPICSGGFVKGTMSGQFFSNESWNFGDAAYGAGGYIFTGSVGAHNADVGYMYGDGTCDQSASTSDTYNGTTIAPSFQAGLNLGQAALPLPTDAFSQQRAVLDGIGACPSSPCTVTQAEMAAPGSPADSARALKNVNGTPWPASGAQPASGVYLPYTSNAFGTCWTPPCFSGGGIYVQGNADQITMAAGTMSVLGVTHKTQVFTIKQGSTTTTVTLDVDPVASPPTTTISDGTTTNVINGLPENLNASPGTEAALLFVNGGISGTSGGTTTGLTGPSSGAAIQDGSAVTVTATNTIAITGNITYKTEPVTLNAADTPTSPVPSNVLGIFTTNGDIQLRPTSNVTTMEVDASLAMISSTSSGGLIAQWNTIGTVNIVGGRIAMQAKSGASVGHRNIYFDQRFSHGFAPPWFPSTTVTATPTTQTVVTPSRMSWTNTTAM
jgi:Tfp pilus assembly protein PilX